MVSNSCTNSNDKVNTNAGGLEDFVIGLMRIYFVFRRNIYRSLAGRLLTSWLYIMPNLLHLEISKTLFKSKFTRACGHISYTQK